MSYSTYTTPLSITQSDEGWTGRSYEYHSTVNGKWVYTLSTHSSNVSLGIRFDPANDQWEDNDTSSYPVSISRDSSGDVRGWNTTSQNSLRFKLACPYFGNTYSGSSGGSGGGGFLSNSPKIENITFTKTSDVSFNLSFDWENISSYTVTNSRNGVVQTVSANLSGSSGSENGPISLTCQDGDLLWVHGNYNNNSLEHHPNEYGGQANPYVFRFVNFSIAGTTLTMSTFFHGSTGLNNDADFRVWDPDAQSWVRLGYVNYDGNLQTQTVTPFERGKVYYIVDRSTGNDYGTRYVAPGTGRRCRGRNFW